MSDTKSRDLELWKKWKTTQSPADLEALMRQMGGTIQSNVNKWASIVPRSVLDNEAKGFALKAFQTYDTSHDTALNTHVNTWLQKLSRIAYERQSTLSVPEHKRILYNQYNRMKLQIEDDLGHPPTVAHMADHLGMPVKKLESLLSEVDKREFLESEEHPEVGVQDEERLLHFAYNDMTPIQQKIFKWKTGYDKSPIHTNAFIMKELNISQGSLSYELTKIKDHLKKAQGRK